jgi:hypothetical protein
VFAYRIAVRYQGARYHIFDLRAESLKAALERAAAELPAEVNETGELAEIRRQGEGVVRETF